MAWSGFEDTLYELDENAIASLAVLEAKRTDDEIRRASLIPKSPHTPHTPHTPGSAGRPKPTRSLSGSWASAAASITAAAEQNKENATKPVTNATANTAGSGSGSGKPPPSPVQRDSKTPRPANRFGLTITTPSTPIGGSGSGSGAANRMYQTPASPNAPDGAIYSTPLSSAVVPATASRSVNYRRGGARDIPPTPAGPGGDGSIAFDSAGIESTALITAAAAAGGNTASALSVTGSDGGSVSGSMSQALIEMQNKQAAINQTNAQLHAMNFFMNYTNATRSQKLAAQLTTVRSDISQGRELLGTLQSKVADHQQLMNGLTTTVQSMDAALSKHQQMLIILAQTMEEQKKVLAESVASQDAKIHYQHTLIQSQSTLLQKLVSVRFRMDAAVDLSIVLISYWLSGSSILRWFVYYPSGIALSPVVMVGRGIVRVLLRSLTTILGVPFIPLQAVWERLRSLGPTASLASSGVSLAAGAAAAPFAAPVVGALSTAAVAGSVASKALTISDAASTAGSLISLPVRVRRVMRFPSPSRLIVVVLRFGVFCYGVVMMREIAARFGLHSVIGSSSEYLALAVRSLRSVWYWIRELIGPTLNRLAEQYPDSIGYICERINSLLLEPIGSAVANRLPQSVFDTLAALEQPPQKQLTAIATTTTTGSATTPNSFPAQQLQSTTGGGGGGATGSTACSTDSPYPYALIPVPSDFNGSAAAAPNTTATATNRPASADARDAVNGMWEVVRSSIPVASSQAMSVLDRSRSVAGSALLSAWAKLQNSIL